MNQKPFTFKKINPQPQTFKSGGGIQPKGMVLLDHNGKPQMKLKGGEIVFSRISTKEIVELASKANSEEEFYELGKAVYDERKAQRKRDKE